VRQLASVRQASTETAASAKEKQGVRALFVRLCRRIEY
jgi:hypothetical protein